MVTCIICLPFVCIYLLHLTFYFCMSRHHETPHHARVLFLRAVQLYLRAIKSLLFFSLSGAQVLSRKLLLARVMSFQRALDRKESKHPYSCNIRYRHLGLCNTEAGQSPFYSCLFWICTHTVLAQRSRLCDTNHRNKVITALHAKGVIAGDPLPAL